MMTPDEQTELYRKVRQNYPRGTARWASGYVHGVRDGLKDDAEPDEAVCDSGFGSDTAQWGYARGYARGFVDAVGVDPLRYPHNDHPHSFWKIAPDAWYVHFRWWDHVA